MEQSLPKHDEDEAQRPPSKRLANKVAVITGGARGIGAASAKLFARNGTHVIVADILDDTGATLADSIGGRYIHCDVSKEVDVESAVELALKWKGRIDIMFNNAGVPGPSGSISSLDMEQVKDLLSINVLGVLHGINYAAAAMIKGRRGGSIICASSSAGIMGGLGGHAYTLSKEALNGLAKSAACDLGVHGTRVNNISPHGVPSEMLVDAYRRHRGRCATVEDVAEGALFMASKDAGFITGHNLVLDGGYTSACSTMSFIYQNSNKDTV